MNKLITIVGAFVAGILLAGLVFPQTASEAEESSTCVVLYPGWNLVTYAGTDAPVRDALGTVEDDITSVYYWTGSEWLGYFPDAPEWVNDLHALENGEPYWVYSEEFTAWAMR